MYKHKVNSGRNNMKEVIKVAIESLSLILDIIRPLNHTYVFWHVLTHIRIMFCIINIYLI